MSKVLVVTYYDAWHESLRVSPQSLAEYVTPYGLNLVSTNVYGIGDLRHCLPVYVYGAKTGTWSLADSGRRVTHQYCSRSTLLTLTFLQARVAVLP